MNIDTGELITLQKDQKPPAGLVQIPDELEQQAIRELSGNQSAFVDLSTSSPLANFARSQRALRNKKRQKIAKASKRRNRR